MSLSRDLSVLLEKNDSLKEITLEFFSNHFPTSYLVCTVFEVLWGLLSKCSVSAWPRGKCCPELSSEPAWGGMCDAIQRGTAVVGNCSQETFPKGGAVGLMRRYVFSDSTNAQVPGLWANGWQTLDPVSKRGINVRCLKPSVLGVYIRHWMYYLRWSF